MKPAFAMRSTSPRRELPWVAAVTLALAFVGSTTADQYDLILRHGTIYDGGGSPPVTGDVAIQGAQIAAIGDLSAGQGKTEIDVQGMAVAPGFINMMCWANESLIADGRSQSDIRQGVTLEVMGEGSRWDRSTSG